jgi:hypothetical protein
MGLNGKTSDEIFSEWMLCKEFSWSWGELMEMPERSYQAFLRITTLSHKKEMRDNPGDGKGG